MTLPCHRLLPLVLVLGGVLRAQVPPPVEPPPWWGILDNDTVSVAWTFNNPLTQPLGNIPPDLMVVPNWFTGTVFTIPANVQWFPQVSGHQGVIGITGPSTAIVSVLVDNDPRPNWNKVFWFQFDGTTLATGQLSAAIRQDLSKYKRANITEKSVQLGNNWVRTTIDALLIPQPTDETVDFTMSDTGTGISGLDNLYMNSKCIKPWRDETGDAEGMPVAPPIDLFTTTGNADCFGVAATEDVTGTRRLWVSGRSPGGGAPHQFFQLNANGGVVAVRNQLATPAVSVNGMTDLTVVPSPTGNLIFGIVQPAAAALSPQLHAIDENTGNPVTPVNVTLPPGTVPFGLTFFPHGQAGAGTFIICDAASGTAHEVGRNGALLRSFATGLPNTFGAGYDAPTGMFYFFGRGPSPDPRNIQVLGSEVSAYNFQPTGVRFYGDLSVPALPGSGPGGIAQGMEVVRLNNNAAIRAGEMRIICIARGAGPAPGGTTSFLYELKGPFRYGYSLLGTIGMRGGAPFRGNQNFGITLDGVPKATFATLYLGFNNQSFLGRPLPANLGFVNPLMVETVVNGQLEIPVISLPVVGGRAGHTIPLPTHPSFAYAPTFWQWMVFDASAPFGITFSQAGKTVLY